MQRPAPFGVRFKSAMDGQQKGNGDMKIMLLGVAAAIAATSLAAPAAAREGRAFVGIPAGHSGHMNGQAHGGWRRGDGNRDRRSLNQGLVAGDWYGGEEWAIDNNRAWDSDSYNDWWHDQPWRAYPAWMRNNQDCQRRWFSGDTLRC
jgi:hypothetical protein